MDIEDIEKNETPKLSKNLCTAVSEEFHAKLQFCKSKNISPAAIVRKLLGEFFDENADFFSDFYKSNHLESLEGFSDSSGPGGPR